MSDIKTLLKYLPKIDYPSDKLLGLADSIDYKGFEQDTFLPGLYGLLGEEGLNKFIQKSIKKLHTIDGIKIDLKTYSWGYYNGSYIYLIIENFDVDLLESDNAITVKYSWGDGKFYNPEKDSFITKKELYEDTDMHEWSEFLDSFEQAASNFFMKNCGYYLYYE